MSASWLVACSGPGAFTAIAVAQTKAQFAFLTGTAVLAVYALSMARRGPFRPVLPTALFFACPYFWMSATRGDCGNGLVGASKIWLAALAVSIGFAAYQRRRRMALQGQSAT